MDNKTPKDKLLDACGVQKSGVPSRPAQDQESKKYYQALLDRAENASAWAQQAQDQTDQSYRRLNDYIRKELPTHMVTAFEKVADQAVRDSLRPLDEGVRKAAGTTNEIGHELSRWTWFWLRDITFCAVAMGLAAGALVYYALNAKLERMDKAKRYEIWGRDVAARMEKSSPKERERILKWVRGGNL